MKRLGCLILVFVLLAGMNAECASAKELEGVRKYWRQIERGDEGYDVFCMKRRLNDMVYSRKTAFNDKFDASTEALVLLFQACNGYPQDGVVTQEQLEHMHSDDAIMYYEMTAEEREKTATPTPHPDVTPTPRPTRAPTRTPVPTLAPGVSSGPMPERDADGYLQNEGEEYYLEDDAEGKWMYLSKNLQVIITLCENPEIPLRWYETEIFCREDEMLKSYENHPEKPGVDFKEPARVARNHQLVLGFSDDLYGYRVANNKVIGSVIRHGRIVSDKTNWTDTTYQPNLDVLAQFRDGTLRAFRCTEYSAEQLLEMGVVNTYCFGPVLLQNSTIDQRVLDGAYKALDPRQALGMIKPGHYLLMTVQGRLPESKGTGLLWIAEYMKEKGVTEALNLDGGNTIAIVFRGRMLNSLGIWRGRKSIRTVTSLIGIGHTVDLRTDD